MLEAIRMELVATTYDAHLAAGQRFDAGTQRIGATQQLVWQANDIEARFMGRKAFVDGHPKGKIPLGAHAEAGYLDINQIRKAANFKPLLERVAAAANAGNITEFNRAVEALNDKIEATAERMVNTRNVAEAGKQVAQVQQALRSILIMYGREMGTEARGTPAHSRAMKLRDRAAAMEEQLKQGQFSPEQHAAFLADVNAERKTARAVAVVSGQIKLNETFRKMAAAAGGTVATEATGALKKADAEFRTARSLIMKGDMEGAREAYERGVNFRSEAVFLYRAERSPGAAAFKVGGRRTRISGVDTAGFSQFQAAARTRELDFYREAHMQAFDALMTGSDEVIERVGRVTTLLEAAVFSIPQQATAQLLTDFANDQNHVISALRAGMMDPSKLERSLQIAEETLTVMQKSMQTNQFVANAGLCVTALGTAFIPVVGPYVSGGIFAGMAIDQIAMEYRVDGHASAGSWAILGLTVASLGLLAGATRLSRLAINASRIGATEHAATLARAAAGMNFANLGIAGTFMVTGGYHAYHSFKQGDYANGILMTGMVLFPLAMTGIGFASAARTRAQRQAVLRELSPEIGASRIPVEDLAPVKSVREISTPQKLFAFLVRLSRANETGRARLLSELPAAEAAKVGRLLENKGVLAAVESGNLSEYAMAALGRAISTFERTPPPSGPRGRRTDRDGAVLVNSPESLRDLVRRLLIPDDAPIPALNERAAARAQLDAIRQRSARAGLIIDELVANKAVQQAVATGNDTAFSTRAFTLAIKGRPKGSKAGPERPGLRELVPDEAVAAEAEAARLYEMDLAVGAEHVVRGEAVEGRPVAMAEGTKPPAEGEAAAKPPPQEVVRITAPERAVRYVSNRVKRWRDSKKSQQQRSTEAPNIEGFSTSARQALDDTIGFAVDEASSQVVIDRATEGMPAREAAELGEVIRTAPQRLGYLMKALYQRATAKGESAENRDAARAAMAKLYSYENVRAILEGYAQTEPQIAVALRQTELSINAAARRAGVSRENLLHSTAREGFNDADVLFIVQTLETETALPVNRARTQLIELETSVIPEIQERLTAAVRRKGADSRAAKSLHGRLVKAQQQARQLRQVINDPGNRPLARSESVFGRRFTQTERASIVSHLMDIGILHGDAILAESSRAANMTSNVVASLPVPELSVRGRRVQDPVAIAFRQQLGKRVGEKGVTTVDDAVLISLRSDEVAASVRRIYGDEIAADFTKAVKEGKHWTVLRFRQPYVKGLEQWLQVQGKVLQETLH